MPAGVLGTPADGEAMQVTVRHANGRVEQMDDRCAEVLVRLGRAVRVVEDSPKPPRPKRVYRRRDMRADPASP